MRRRTRRRIKNISLATMAVGCAFGFFTLLIQPKELHKGMLLGFCFGVCCGIRLTEEG